MRIQGAVLAKNMTLNLIGSAVPLLVVVFAVPRIIHGLGVERFGVLSLAWVVLGYFSLTELGLSRATTMFVADALGRGEGNRIRSIVWTSLSVQLVLGTMGMLALAAATPFLVEKVLRIPPELMSETKTTFYLIGVSIPVVLWSINLSGVLEAAQRFDLVNAVRIPANSLVFLVPAVAVSRGYDLPGIMLLLILARLLAVAVFLRLCLRVFPILREGFSFDSKLLLTLLRYGGWVTVCNVLIPILVYVDRFVVGAVLSVAAVGYYTLPYETVSRLQIIPGNLGRTLFPVFSSFGALGKERLEGLYARGLKSTVLLMGPIVLVIILFARDILRLWVGNDFAEKSTIVLQILALGMLLNALAQIPANLLDGIGRPDLRAKTFLAYVVPYLGLLWFLTAKMGIVGTALAWTLRAAAELALFLGLSFKIMRLHPLKFVQNSLLRPSLACAVLVAITVLFRVVLGGRMVAQAVAAVVCLVAFSALSWRLVLDSLERQSLLALIGKGGKN